ncbi:hypothetical protein [Acidisoma sp. L85]|uniref:hypothetical protein n=1 Tax=Acidisoma sp. L85 TaxID=1641850 RepID=UPI00131D35CC|nr:hypothetical protein [Acidisoma sp. L85]
MSDVQAGSASSTSKDVADDLAVLKSDVAALIKEMKDLAIREGSRIGQNAAEKISESAFEIYGGVSKQTQRSAEAVSQHVQDWPISSLLVAFVGGFALSKLFTR